MKGYTVFLKPEKLFRTTNSALIVTITPEDYGTDSPLDGMEFQRRLEEKAYELGQGKIPIQQYGDF